MRAFILVLIVLLAGCTAPAATPTPTTTDSTPTFSQNPPIMTCPEATDAPAQTVPTHEPGTHQIPVLVAHRDGVASYTANGTHGVTKPNRELLLGFSDGLGYRFLPDASGVHDDDGLHVFNAQLQRTAWWNSTHLGAAIRGDAHYYATAGGKLYVLSDALSSVHDQPIAGWVAPDEPRYDALALHEDVLVLGSAGRPDRILVYDLSDAARPTLLKEIHIAAPEVPVTRSDGAAGPGHGGRPTPWTQSHFAHIRSGSEAVWVWRDGSYQGDPAQGVSRFQDFISIRATDWTVQRIEQEYLEDNHYGTTNGVHVGPIDQEAAWALLHVRGMFTLASMVQNATHVVSRCQIDIQLSSFAADDAYFHRNGDTVVTGTQHRASAWDVGTERARLAEMEFPKVATDIRAL